MAYRLRYEVKLDWVGQGVGPMSGAMAVVSGQEAGGAQTLQVNNTPGGQNIVGSGTSGAITSANMATLAAAMAADVQAQLQAAAVLNQAAGWATGGN